MNFPKAMTILLITAAISFLAVLAAKKRRPSKETTRRAGLASTSPSVRQQVAIPANRQQIDEERQSNEEIMRLVEAAIGSSGVFLPEKISYLMEKLRSGFSPFTRVNTKSASEGDVTLTVAEKKALGLNTRMKYSKAFIDCFDPSAFNRIEPKAFLENIHLDAFHRVSRKNDLRKFRQIGVRTVEILDVGDAGDCSKIKRFKKVHNFDEVPELPLPGCTAPYCRCMYLAKTFE
jgi:hypothetical protein